MERLLIDFVLTWVDEEDIAWRAERELYSPDPGSDLLEGKYRDWGNLQYWFRGVDKFAPWVHRIYFVTWGHIPVWLNTKHPKLKVVRHDEFMNPEYLPTFNINPIELNFHHLPDLQEHFVYFNDDMFLTKEVAPEDFFIDGLPRDSCIETALIQDDINNSFANILMNDSALVNMHFSKREVIRAQKSKWFHPIYGFSMLRNILMLPYHKFSGFKYTHLPSALLKTSFERVWQDEGAILDQVCHHRFRSVFDVNQYLIKYWQYMSGQFVPQSPRIGQFFMIGPDDVKIRQAIETQKYKMICLNDGPLVLDYQQERQEIMRLFDLILPNKSSFEL